MTFKDTGDYYKFYINDLLHLCFAKEEFVGTWAYVNGIEEKAFYLDIIFKSTTVTVQYKSREIWETSLKIFDKSIK
jgi:hypothetical protein